MLMLLEAGRFELSLCSTLMTTRRVNLGALDLVDKIIRKSPAFSSKGQQGSSSFLKKRTKKLLPC
jgi:hypothetical protein